MNTKLVFTFLLLSSALVSVFAGDRNLSRLKRGFWDATGDGKSGDGQSGDNGEDARTDNGLNPNNCPQVKQECPHCLMEMSPDLTNNLCDHELVADVLLNGDPECGQMTISKAIKMDEIDPNLKYAFSMLKTCEQCVQLLGKTVSLITSYNAYSYVDDGFTLGQETHLVLGATPPLNCAINRRSILSEPTVNEMSSTTTSTSTTPSPIETTPEPVSVLPTTAPTEPFIFPTPYTFPDIPTTNVNIGNERPNHLDNPVIDPDDKARRNVQEATQTNEEAPETSADPGSGNLTPESGPSSPQTDHNTRSYPTSTYGNQQMNEYSDKKFEYPHTQTEYNSPVYSPYNKPPGYLNTGYFTAQSLQYGAGNPPAVNPAYYYLSKSQAYNGPRYQPSRLNPKPLYHPIMTIGSNYRPALAPNYGQTYQPMVYLSPVNYQTPYHQLVPNTYGTPLVAPNRPNNPPASYGMQPSPSYSLSSAPNSYGSQSSIPSYGSQPSVPSYGSQPSVPSYGSQPSVPSYGSQPPVPSYGSQPPVPSYGSQPPVPSYGSQPPVPSYGSQPPVPSYGSQPPVPSYNSQPPAPANSYQSVNYSSGPISYNSIAPQPYGKMPNMTLSYESLANNYTNGMMTQYTQQSYSPAPKYQPAVPTYNSYVPSNQTSYSSAPSYSPQPSSPSYGSQPSAPNYGPQPAVSSYASQPSKPSYGSSPQNSYRPQPSAPSYGAQPPQASYAKRGIVQMNQLPAIPSNSYSSVQSSPSYGHSLSQPYASGYSAVQSYSSVFSSPNDYFASSSDHDSVVFSASCPKCIEDVAEPELIDSLCDFNQIFVVSKNSESDVEDHNSYGRFVIDNVIRVKEVDLQVNSTFSYSNGPDCQCTQLDDSSALLLTKGQSWESREANDSSDNENQKRYNLLLSDQSLLLKFSELHREDIERMVRDKNCL